MEVHVSHVGFGASTRLAPVRSLYMSLILFVFFRSVCVKLFCFSSRHDRSREFFLIVTDIVSMSPGVLFSFKSMFVQSLHRNRLVWNAWCDGRFEASL